MSQEFNLMSHKGYQEARERYTKIKSQLDEVEAELQTLLLKGKPEHLQSQKDRQVAAVLRGKEPDHVEERGKWHEDIRKLTQRRNLFLEAETKQKQKITKEQMKASKEICEKVKPNYLKDGNNVFLALIRLAETLVVIREWKDEFKQEDIAYTSYLPVLSNFGLGDPYDPYSRFASLMVEGVRQGFITSNDVPKNLRDSWCRSNGFKFEGDKITSTPYDEKEYAKGLMGKNVSSVVSKSRMSSHGIGEGESEWTTK